MEEEYWKRFLKTGSIKDYLYYKGMKICTQVMERYGLMDEVHPPEGHASRQALGWTSLDDAHAPE